MIHRLLTLPPRRSCIVLGPRQTGKSTLIRSLLPADAWSVDLLDRADHLRLSKDPSQFRREAEAAIARGARTVFVDEVQKVPALLDEVHALIESTKARFLLSGSSARKLRRGGSNLLAGRASVRNLHPLTTSEQGELFDLERTLRLGALPAVVTSNNEDARELLSAYAQTYLREEIMEEAVVRNLGGFARFLDVVAAQCGDILNYSAVGRDAGIATRTVQGYYQILEDTLLGFRLDAWRKSPRARLVTHPRFYLFDTGVTNALNRRLGHHLDSSERGRLFEQLVVLEARRLCDYFEPEAQLFYWRTNAGAEVDLLIELHGKLRLAVEIKSKARVAGADLSGLRSFQEAHPRTPCAIVATVPHAFRLEGVDVLPFPVFAAELIERVRGNT
jgi:predicted AAA+ superfamily ATPase